MIVSVNETNLIRRNSYYLVLKLFSDLSIDVHKLTTDSVSR
jgi:hypothetical protein